MALEIKWNAAYNGVEILTDKDHFVVDAGPSFAISYVDAMRLCKRSQYALPTMRQLKTISRHLDQINNIMAENDGYRIYKQWHNTRDTDGTYMRIVNTEHGAVLHDSIHVPFHARVVFDLTEANL